MLEYFYNEITKEFEYCDNAALDPEMTIRTGKNVYLSAANATFIQPLQPKNGYAVIFNGESWEYVQNHKGLRVWKEDFSNMIIQQFGPIPQGYSINQPELPLTIQDFDNILESYIKEVRVERGYTTRQPDVYLNSKNERWKQDAMDFIQFRDACMEYALSVYNQYEQTQKLPQIQEFKNNLPKIKWTFE